MNLLINSEYGGYYYDLFYRLSFLVCFGIFLIESWRRKYPLSTILLIAATTIFFAILGSKISAVSWAEWKAFLTTGAPLALDGKSSFGALLFGWLGIGIAQRTLGFKRSVLDLYLLALPITLIFQRLGCLMAGCCYGSASTLPWAMEYGREHVAWKVQHAQGLIDGMSEHTLAIHPVPLYFILAFLLIILLALHFGRRFRANGNQTLFVLVLLFGFRFFIEFFRDPVTNHGWGEAFWGIKQIQWLLLGFVLILSAIISFRERRYRPVTESDPFTAKRQIARQLALWAIPPLGLWLLPGWFSFSEITIIHAHVLFAALALAWIAFHQFTHPRLRGVTAVLLIVALFSMGQTYQDLPAENRDHQPKIIQSVTFGFLEGRNPYEYDQRGDAIPGTTKYTYGGSCYGTEYTTDHYNAGPYFTAGGATFERLKEKKPQLYKGLRIGAHLTSYNLRKFGVETKRINDFGFMANYSWLQPRSRVDLGFHIGNFEHTLGKPIETMILPVFRLRLGLPKEAFLDAGFGSDLPFGTTTSLWRVGAGVGLPLFGAEYEGGLRFGLTNIGDKNAYYLSPYIPLGKVDLLPTFRFNTQEKINNFGLILKWNLEGMRSY